MENLVQVLKVDRFHTVLGVRYVERRLKPFDFMNLHWKLQSYVLTCGCTQVETVKPYEQKCLLIKLKSPLDTI